MSQSKEEKKHFYLRHNDALMNSTKLSMKAKQSGEIRETLDTSVLARNLMSVSGSMLNIELEQANFQYMFSDTRMQFEQYYMLIKK